MGSAAAFHLSRRGYRVIAFERFRPVHEFGSHSGRTRIIRHAYHESPDYVPLVLRADALWCELEVASGHPLLIRTGGLDIGPEGCSFVTGALQACQLHNLPYEHLKAEGIMKQWPQFRIPDNWEACYNAQAGFLLVDRCIQAHLCEARTQGGRICEEEPVISFNDPGSCVQIRTDKDVYEVGCLVVCAGAWASWVLEELKLPLVVKRKTLAWLRPKNPADFAPEKFPVFITEGEEGALYGFPLYNHPGIKIANHYGGIEVHPDQVDRVFHETEAGEIRSFVRKYLPGITEEVLDGKVCLYTLTPDEHFIIDFYPGKRNIVIAAGFSGHGFKFAPVVGEILADLATEGKTRHPIDKFRISRFL
ncbi:MAG: N-methyl-L-tryptophan oxidase [Nitrospira sp.]|nr:N-methyl-L-tryptophan oxidase [Nitrospira sp.]